ncbi:hypothetical protein [Erwinia typographi]|uniref:hypothetical protein n=1 Tax=Erwinia typographi TaxID=371042 RepID=UPI00068A2495|nr:hypothetical protein [Erwinia typographi]
MSISRKEKIEQTIYNDGVAVSNDTLDIDVSYTIRSVDNFNGTTATGVFVREVNGVAYSEPFRFIFKYSGAGNPLEQAEPALQKYFETQDAPASSTSTEASS